MMEKLQSFRLAEEAFVRTRPPAAHLPRLLANKGRGVIRKECRRAVQQCIIP
jgi:hypothetical protein